MQNSANVEDRESLTSVPKPVCARFFGVPEQVATYLAHTAGRVPIRALARAKGCHASTILRQIRRMEQKRDDPMFDEAVNAADQLIIMKNTQPVSSEELAAMVANAARCLEETSELINREARRILRRLCEKDAFLAVANGMEKAIVMRETVPGRQTRTAVVDREVAHKFVLLDWITCLSAGKIAKYNITQVGRAALKRLLEEDRAARSKKLGFAEAATPFQAQHQEFGERKIPASDGKGAQVVRLNLAESPLLVLGRRKDRAGVPYLSPDLIEAGERLRESFELAQMGPRVTQNWERFLTTGGSSSGPRGPSEGPQAAREQVAKAMTVLGPGLSDVAMRVCCFLEGLEAAERRLGWSARSGKVVLKIALQRLALHYNISAPSKTADH